MQINALQILRAVAALMVVVWHSFLATKHAIHNYWPEGDALFRAAHYPSPLNHLYFGVDIFFAISGFIMCMLVESALTSRSFLIRRAIRILPPYWSFTALVVVAYIGSGGKFNLGHMIGDFDDAYRVLASFLLVPQDEAPILNVGWSLIHEALFYLLCGLTIATGLRNRLPETLAILSFASIALALLGLTLAYGYVLSPYYVEFLCGALAYRLSSRAFRWPALILTCGLALYLAVCALFDLGYFPNYTFIVRVLAGGAIGFCLIIGLIGLDREFSISQCALGQLFVRIGDASYTLYLMHWLVLSIMGKVLGVIWSSAPVGAIAVWQIISIVVAVVLALAVAERIELPFHARLVRMSRQTT